MKLSSIMNHISQSQISSLTILSILTLDRTEEFRRILNENLFIVRIGEYTFKANISKDIAPYAYLSRSLSAIEYLYVSNCGWVSSEGWAKVFIEYLDNKISQDELLNRVRDDEGLISDLKCCKHISIECLNDITDIL